MEFTTQSFTIADLYNWHNTGELDLSPRFQRRLVWSNAARSYLVDTVARGLPMPKIFYRMQIDPVAIKSVREVVDGQQRLRALFSFIDGEFTVYASHNEDIGGRRFARLPEEVRDAILRYEITADLLIGATDTAVLQIFARINSYSVTLNDQEKRNAKFAGAFKSLAYDLGTRHLEFWLGAKVLGDADIARMREAELASELIIGLVDGLQDKKASIDKFYEKYEDDFPNRRSVIQKFQRVLTWIDVNIGKETIRETAFHRRPMFYSLFLATADALSGIPRGRGPVPNLASEMTARQATAARAALVRLSEALAEEEPPTKLVDFVVASARQTDNVGPRRIRHNAVLRVLREAAQK